MSRASLHTIRLLGLQIKPCFKSSRPFSTTLCAGRSPLFLGISEPGASRSIQTHIGATRRDVARYVHRAAPNSAQKQGELPIRGKEPSSTKQPGLAPMSGSEDGVEELHESPYTIPNALTLARICACPFLGYTIVNGQYGWATGILLASGFSDWLDGYIARRYNLKSVLGSILDPAADKALMTTLVVTLAWSGLLPLPLAILILGRDVALSISAFYFRYISLPRPRTFERYFDVSIPSAEVKPTQISKINTALQLVLMGVTTVSPLLTIPIAAPLGLLQWTVAGTTIWSGLSYVNRAGVKILQKSKKL